jgi:hypothetical protein
MFLLAVLVGGLALAASGSAKTPHRLVVKVGTNRIYTRAELRPGATVVCIYEKRTLSVTEPTGYQEGNGAVWPKPGTANAGIFHLNVDVAAGNRYSVTCGRGGLHW